MRASTRVAGSSADERAGLSVTRARWLLLGVIVLAALLRLSMLAAWQDSVYRDALLIDESYYHRWASQIADGTWQSNDVYEMSPVPAYLMAAVYRLVGAEPMAVRLLNAVLGVVACGVVYLGGRAVDGRACGLLTAGLMAVYQPLVLRDITVLKTSLTALLSACLVSAVLVWWRSDARWPLILAGLSGGLILGVRPNAAVLLVVLLVAVLWRGRKRLTAAIVDALILCLALLSTTAPILIRNLVIAETPAITTTQMGHDLFLGNNPESGMDRWPYYRPSRFASSTPVLQGAHFAIEASRRVGRELDAAEASAYWTSVVIDSFVENSFDRLMHLVIKAAATVSTYTAADHYDATTMAPSLWPLRLPLPGFGTILVLAILALVRTGHQSHDALPRGWLLLIWLALAYGGTLVLFFCNERYRVPLVILLLPLAGLGLRRLLRWLWLRRWSRLARAAGPIVLLGLLINLGLPGGRDHTAGLNTHASMLEAAGRRDEAIQTWRRSSESQGVFSAYADLALAARLARDGEASAAMTQLKRISDSSFAASDRESLLGDVLAAQGRFREAAAAYRRSLSINSGRLETRARLVKVLQRLDDPAAIDEYTELLRLSRFVRGGLLGSGRPGAGSSS